LERRGEDGRGRGRKSEGARKEGGERKRGGRDREVEEMPLIFSQRRESGRYIDLDASRLILEEQILR